MTVHGRFSYAALAHLARYLARYLLRPPAASVGKSTRRAPYGGVGANIGDTLAAFDPQSDDHLLAIEPDPTFFDCLQHNWGRDPRVTLRQEFCGAACGEMRAVIHKRDGSATITPADHGQPMRCTTLDALTQNAPFASGVDLLKIDTDGHEFEVLEGARDLLQRDRPALLIECDARGDPAFGERCAELVAQSPTATTDF